MLAWCLERSDCLEPVAVTALPRLARIAGHEIAERHGIAQAIDRRDAVLPFPSRRAAQQIGRAGGNFARGALPPLALLAAKPQGAGRQERDRDDVLEHRLVAVPADAGA